MIGHLLSLPPGADAKVEASDRDVVAARDLLGGIDGVWLDDEADAGRDPELFRGEGRRCERNERVERMPVVLRQLCTTRPRALPAGWDVGMLGHPERFESRLLDQGRELGH